MSYDFINLVRYTDPKLVINYPVCPQCHSKSYVGFVDRQRIKVDSKLTYWHVSIRMNLRWGCTHCVISFMTPEECHILVRDSKGNPLGRGFFR